MEDEIWRMSVNELDLWGFVPLEFAFCFECLAFAHTKVKQPMKMVNTTLRAYSFLNSDG
jgi:hypothetical protein